MGVLICLLVLAELGPGYYRAPRRTGAPAPMGGPVWVYFTDKGIADDNGYRAAIEALTYTSSPARALRRSGLPRPGYDFADLPVRQEYVRRIEAMGGKLRRTSDWLNAASFELAPDLQPAVLRLPFVYDIQALGRDTRPDLDAALPLRGGRPVRAQSVDTAEAHRFYGPSYDQAEMMGVPEVFFQGYYGTGVKLAIFDTGLRLDNVAVRDLRIERQHDFLSGDNFQTASSEDDWEPRPVEGLDYLGFVKDPILGYPDEDRGLLVFVADSFSYRHTSPRRGLFAAGTSDGGRSWSTPALLALSSPASQVSSHTFEGLRLADADFATYLAYGDVAYNNGGLAANVWLSWFQGDSWRAPVRVGVGRRPAIAAANDSLFFAFVENDTVIRFERATVSAELPYPNWVAGTVLYTRERIDDLELAAEGSGDVVILAATMETDRLLQFRSSDGGETFSDAEEVVAGGALDATLLLDSDMLVALYRDVTVPPFTRLSVLRSDDFGLTWSHATAVAESTLSIGGYSAWLDNEGLCLLYETGGLLHRSMSEDFGLGWTEPVVLDTAGFCYMPTIARAGEGMQAAWFKRGDDNTIWDNTDTLKFSPTQPDHGTRMASIIAGYQQGGIVGIAPGVDLFIAKTELHKVSSGRYYEYDLEEDTYIEALEWAERNGVDIVSTSLGYRGWYTDEQMDGRTAPISVAASLAAARGVLIVTAMGNRDTTRYPLDRPYITAPADAEGVISAGGVQRNLTMWRGTGTGPTADGRSKPDLVALSDTVAVVDPDSSDGLEGSVGTSCATALIAGACALIKEAHPGWSADSIKAALFSTATRSSPSCTFGLGVPRVDSAYVIYPPDPTVEPVPGDHVWTFPNPFVPSVHGSVYFALDLARPTTRARIAVFTSSGVLVDTIRLNPEQMGRPGRYDDVELLRSAGAFWDGTNSAGEPVGSGIYLAVLESTFGDAVGKFALVR